MLQTRLSETAGRALRALLAVGAATRPELSARLGVTKQTVSAAILELEQRTLVEAVDVQHGRTGRTAVRYGLHSRGGWVAGVDLGSARLRVAAATLDGRIVADRIVSNPVATASRDWPDQLPAAALALADVAQAMTHSEGGLLGVGLAVPRPVADRRDLVGEQLEEADELLLTALAPVAPAAIWLENDVNCEAIAQLRYRSGPVPASVLHLHIGVGIGAALIVNGQVVRGARGRSGEIKQLRSPLPDRSESAEGALAAAGLLAAAGHSATTRMSAGLDDLFAAAAVGEPAAELAVFEEAAGIAALLMELAAVVDPDLTVLSGQIGGRADLQTLVRAECMKAGLPINLAEDTLGDASAVMGAAALAADQVLASLTGLV